MRKEKGLEKLTTDLGFAAIVFGLWIREKYLEAKEALGKPFGYELAFDEEELFSGSRYVIKSVSQE